MADKTDGGSAFPTVQEISEPPAMPGFEAFVKATENMPLAGPREKTTIVRGGMSMRDYFAGQALTALISRPEAMVIATAQAAYSYADAMLAERAK